MKINKLTINDILRLMGSYSTEDEAKRMLYILVSSAYKDTDDIPLGVWSKFVAQAIVKAAIEGPDEKWYFDLKNGYICDNEGGAVAKLCKYEGKDEFYGRLFEKSMEMLKELKAVLPILRERLPTERYNTAKALIKYIDKG